MTVRHEETNTIRAAGCVLWRRSAIDDGLELALVYRPKWADWSFPKGKAKRGEALRETALREVLEETGMACTLGPPLPTAHYLDAQRRPKEVRYWAAEATAGRFAPNSEVSRLEWLAPAAASVKLTHDRDKALLTAFLDTLRAVGEAR
ncbi:NUDIX hydrolase [Streptomyces kunmingensis]